MRSVGDVVAAAADAFGDDAKVGDDRVGTADGGGGVDTDDGETAAEVDGPAGGFVDGIWLNRE